MGRINGFQYKILRNACPKKKISLNYITSGNYDRWLILIILTKSRHLMVSMYQILTVTNTSQVVRFFMDSDHNVLILFSDI